MNGLAALLTGVRDLVVAIFRDRLTSPQRVAVVAAALTAGWMVDRTNALDGSHLGEGRGPIDVTVSRDGAQLFVADINDHAVVTLATDDGRVLARDSFPGRPIVLAWSRARPVPVVSFQDRPDVCEVRPERKPEKRAWMPADRSGVNVDWGEFFEPVRDSRCFVPSDAGTPLPTTSPPSPRDGDDSGDEQLGPPRNRKPNFGTWGIGAEADGSIVVVRNDGREQQAARSIQVLRMRPRDPSGWDAAGASAWIPLGRLDWAALPWPVVAVPERGEIVVVEPPDGRIYVLDSALVVKRSATVGGYLKSIWVDANRARIYAADQKTGVVRAIDLDTLAVLMEHATGAGAARLAADPSGGVLWVANQFADRISCLEMEGFAPCGELPAATRPSALAFDRRSRRMFAAFLGTDRVVRWDTANGRAGVLALTTLRPS